MRVFSLDRGAGETIAYAKVEGHGPTIVWLGGFRSQMTGAKARALSDWAERVGRSYLRFDYYGHGASSGRFEDGVVSRWREDALAVVDGLTDRPLILVGSSMGGWIATLTALARPARIAGLVLIAPAADMTDTLIEPQLTAGARLELERHGVWRRPSPYGDGDPITCALLEDGRRWSVLPGPIACDAPLRVLQGGADTDVPWSHALALANAWSGPDVVFSLIRDGDHRLSRPQDLARLVAEIEALA